MPKSVKTFLMFDGAAEAAVRLYVSLFHGAVESKPIARVT